MKRLPICEKMLASPTRFGQILANHTKTAKGGKKGIGPPSQADLLAVTNANGLSMAQYFSLI